MTGIFDIDIVYFLIYCYNCFIVIMLFYNVSVLFSYHSCHCVLSTYWIWNKYNAMQLPSDIIKYSSLNIHKLQLPVAIRQTEQTTNIDSALSSNIDSVGNHVPRDKDSF